MISPMKLDKDEEKEVAKLLINDFWKSSYCLIYDQKLELWEHEFNGYGGCEFEHFTDDQLHHMIVNRLGSDILTARVLCLFENKECIFNL